MRVRWKTTQEPVIQGVSKSPTAEDVPPSRRWVRNEEAYLIDEMYWPTANVWIPGPVTPFGDYSLTKSWVRDWRKREFLPALVGHNGALQGTEFWFKLTDEPSTSDFSGLFVTQGAERAIAGVLDGEKWVRATKQPAPMVSFYGGWVPGGKDWRPGWPSSM